MRFLTSGIALALTAAAFVLNLLILQFTDLDLMIQDKAYNFRAQKWLLYDIHARYGWLLYSGIKAVLACFALVLLILWALSYTEKYANLRQYRRIFLCIVLSMALCPLIASQAKQVTNVYSPYQIERYGGEKPFVKPFSKYPAGYVQPEKGKGFPAGHAAGGFALFSLFFVFKERKRSILFGCLGTGVGVFMGTYQILRGQHYLGDTLVTVLGCLLLNMLIFRLLPVFPESEIAQASHSQ